MEIRAEIKIVIFHEIMTFRSKLPRLARFSVKTMEIRNFAYKVSIEMLIEFGWSLIGRA